MKRVLTTVLAVALLLGLGALAVLAMPSANAPLTAAPVVAAAAAAPDAPSGTNRYNLIGMPLYAADQFTSHTPTLGFDSDGLADLVGSSVSQVLRWNAGRQDFDSWDPVYNEGYVNGDPIEIPYALAVGGAYWLLVDSTGPSVVSFVGDVPEAGDVDFTLVGASTGCAYNQITIPLEQDGLTDADLLADDISLTEVSQVLRWNATRQDFDSWDPFYGEGYVDGNPVEVPWEVKIGYPYMVCLKAGVNGNIWPQ